MSSKYSIDFTVALTKSLYFYSHKESHSLLEISEKVPIAEKYQKSEFDKYATSGVSASSITSIYPIYHVPE